MCFERLKFQNLLSVGFVIVALKKERKECFYVDNCIGNLLIKFYQVKLLGAARRYI